MKRDLYGVPESERELIDAIDTIRPGIELHNYTYHFSPPARRELICSNGIHAAQLVGSHTVEASAPLGIGVWQYLRIKNWLRRG